MRMKVDSNRFWRLLEPIHPQAQGFCRKLAGDRENGDDLYQEALLTALDRLRSLRQDDSFRPWLYRIIVNRYKNQCRRPWWRRRAELTEDTVELKMSNDPTKDYSFKRWMERALSVLSAGDRSLVLLSDMEGWPMSELARIYNKPEGTIKAKLSRLRQKMRKVITDSMPPSKIFELLGEEYYALPRGKKESE